MEIKFTSNEFRIKEDGKLIELYNSGDRTLECDLSTFLKLIEAVDVSSVNTEFARQFRVEEQKIEDLKELKKTLDQKISRLFSKKGKLMTEMNPQFLTAIREVIKSYGVELCNEFISTISDVVKNRDNPVEPIPEGTPLS